MYGLGFWVFGGLENIEKIISEKKQNRTYERYCIGCKITMFTFFLLPVRLGLRLRSNWFLGLIGGSSTGVGGFAGCLVRGFAGRRIRRFAWSLVRRFAGSRVSRFAWCLVSGFAWCRVSRFARCLV